MVTVAQLVADTISKKPFLEEALVNGIINYAYLADLIMPEIEKGMRHRVNRYAIIMAIRRFSETLKESFVGQKLASLDGADITITSGIFELTAVKNAETINAVSRLYSLVDFSKGDFLTVTQGLYEITLLSNARYKGEMLGLFDKKDVKDVITGLSSLTVRMPKAAAEDVGLLYTLTKALSWENINIFEVVSTLSEEAFIISEGDAATAFAVIKKLIAGK